MRALKDEDFAARDRPAEAGGRERPLAGRPALRGLRAHPRGGAPRDRPAPLRRAAHRRACSCTRAASPRCAPVKARPSSPRCPRYLNALVRPRRARRHRERLPRPPRRRVDGPGLQLPRPDRGLHRPRPRPTRSARTSYRCDITYGQNNEFGFDYLRDNMKFRLQDYVQRELNFAIVDEVDSILIDEARTPLIISGPTEDTHRQVLPGRPGHPRARAGPGLHARREARSRSALTDDGVEKLQKRLEHRQPLRPERDRDAPPRRAGPARAHALQARQRLRGEGRRGA